MKKLRASKAVYFILLTTLVVAVQIGILDWNLENYFLNLEEKTEVKDYSLPYLPHASDPDAFISRWDTTKYGDSGNDQIELPLTSSGEYVFFVDWGDETNDTIILYNQAEIRHTYPISGIYTVNITGTIVGWKFGGDSEKIIEIQQWGCLRLGNTGNYFAYCSNLVISATDNLDLTGTTTLRYAFQYCYDLGVTGNMNGWDTSNVTDMSYMFYYALDFNQPIGNWNVSKVTTMAYMFYLANDFNQSIGNWNVSKVTTMVYMFYYALDFNQPIGNWNVSKVTTMAYMFYLANDFNQSIGNWNVSKVTNMYGMFSYSSKFNQPLENWDVSSVTNMQSMFSSAFEFNQPLENWNVSRVTNMQSMFSSTYEFNQPLENWNVSKVSNMYGMFYYSRKFNQPLENWDISSVTNIQSMFSGTYEFNQPLENWNVSKVTNMYGMFSYSRKFNQPLESWDVSRVTNMQSMFSSTYEFNQPLENWNVSKVTNMYGMFYYSRKFNQPLGNWDVSKVTNMANMLYQVTLSREFYDQTVVGWSQLSLQTGVNFHGGSSKYSSIGLPGREILTDTYDWIITDGGYDPLAVKSVLTSTADAPDRDGNFILNWTAEYQANNYSLYQFSSPITEINGSLTLLVENSSVLSFEINDYVTDTYYFVVTGNNDFGQKLSNCMEIAVDLNPGAFSLSSDAQSPDLDGIFTLSWTDSELVEYYIVYQHSSLITDLNGSLTVVASEFTSTNMNLSDFIEGMYYFLVVAVNPYNITLSNCIQVVIDIPETITVLNPTMTTSIYPDSQLLIQWVSTGLISHVKLEFYKGDSFVIEIIGMTENDGEFLWLIPTYIGQSEEYRVKIIDTSNTTVFVFSEMFTITPNIPQETKPSPTPLILSIIGLVIATGAAGLTTYMFFEQRKTRKIE